MRLKIANIAHRSTWTSITGMIIHYSVGCWDSEARAVPCRNQEQAIIIIITRPQWNCKIQQQELPKTWSTQSSTRTPWAQLISKENLRKAQVQYSRRSLAPRTKTSKTLHDFCPIMKLIAIRSCLPVSMKKRQKISRDGLQELTIWSWWSHQGWIRASWWIRMKEAMIRRVLVEPRRLGACLIVKSSRGASRWCSSLKT